MRKIPRAVIDHPVLVRATDLFRVFVYRDEGGISDRGKITRIS